MTIRQMLQDIKSLHRDTLNLAAMQQMALDLTFEDLDHMRGLVETGYPKTAYKYLLIKSRKLT